MEALDAGFDDIFLYFFCKLFGCFFQVGEEGRVVDNLDPVFVIQQIAHHHVHVVLAEGKVHAVIYLGCVGLQLE